MKKKQSSKIAKIGLMAALAFSFPLVQAPATYCFASDDPIQDGSKGKPKQGPDKKETPKTEEPQKLDTVTLLLLWLLGF